MDLADEFHEAELVAVSRKSVARESHLGVTQ